MLKLFSKPATWMIFSVLAVLSVSPVKSAPLAGGLALLTPSACPPSGCAAGQRLNLEVDFNPAPIVFSGPNVQVCVFAPDNWADKSTFTVAATGVKTNLPYTAGEIKAICSTNPNRPNQTILLGGAYTTIPAGVSADGLTFVFRINQNSSIAGNVIVQIYDPTLPDTTLPVQTYPLSINVVSASSPAYIADDAATCANNSPCFVNSGDDLPNGIGTGLKDALDAVPAPAPPALVTLNILGTVHVKSNTIQVDKPDIILGTNNAGLVYSGTTCTNPMLAITAGATLQNLAIDGGTACAGPARDLITINSPKDVSILSTNLTNGKNAVTLSDNTGSAIVESNQIQNNRGYGILRQPGNSAGLIQAAVNNIYNNQNGVQAECNDNDQHHSH